MLSLSPPILTTQTTSSSISTAGPPHRASLKSWLSSSSWCVWPYLHALRPHWPGTVREPYLGLEGLAMGEGMDQDIAVGMAALVVLVVRMELETATVMEDLEGTIMTLGLARGLSSPWQPSASLPAWSSSSSSCPTRACLSPGCSTSLWWLCVPS